MQLSDRDIKAALATGRLRIEGFRKTNLTPNGYDLTVGEVLLRDSEEVVKEGIARISSHASFLVSTAEVVTLGPDLVGDLWIRSTWARRGFLGSFGKVDAGFDGTLTLGAFNAAGEAVELPIGETFAQITFHELVTPSERSYQDRSGTYQGQRGVTLPRSGGPARSGPGSGSSLGPP